MAQKHRIDFNTYGDCCDQVLKDLRAHGEATFSIDTPNYFPNSSERCVEIPWALSNFRGHERILDVGVSLADQVYFGSLLQLFELGANEIHGVDIVPLERTRGRFADLPSELVDRVQFKRADVRSTGYPNDHFDQIFLISSVEHVGFDKALDAEDTAFDRPLEKPPTVPALRDHRGDLDAMTELGRIVRPGGSLIVTVPFGLSGAVMMQDSKSRYCFFVQYDYARWQLLLRHSGLRLEEERFFGLSPGLGWKEVEDPSTLEEVPYLVQEVTAQAVACARLTKDPN